MTKRALGATTPRASCRTYLETGILADDPFTSIDEEGIGVLSALAAGEGRRTRRELKLGLCGEHGRRPEERALLRARGGSTYVSCSPFRVPIARPRRRAGRAGEGK